jgi:response regulator RpfG family c-di-GMP phosphodiesterase
MTNKNKWLVLLTTCVKTHANNSIADQNYRIDLYKQQIQKWLNNTNYHIVVVESSGYDICNNITRNERLHSYTTIITNCVSSSQSEASSMLYVLEQIKNEDFYINCTHILKVTGRYYLQNIEHILENYPKQNMNMYVQKHRLIKWQNSEYYGIKKELLNKFLETVVVTGLMEQKLYDFIITHRKTVLLPGFPNNIARGGDRLIINPL